MVMTAEQEILLDTGRKLLEIRIHDQRVKLEATEAIRIAEAKPHWEAFLVAVGKEIPEPIWEWSNFKEIPRGFTDHSSYFGVEIITPAGGKVEGRYNYGNEGWKRTDPWEYWTSIPGNEYSNSVNREEKFLIALAITHQNALECAAHDAKEQANAQVDDRKNASVSGRLLLALREFVDEPPF